MEYLLRLILMLVIYTTTCNGAQPRRCRAGSELFACILSTFDYESGGDIPVFEIPADVKSIRFSDPLINIHDKDNAIKQYDHVLHLQLKSPQAIELTDGQTKLVEIPSNLEYADFSSNSITHVNVPLNQSYALRYLDLNDNSYLSDQPVMENISRLVNLETLHLSSCGIKTFPPNMFQNLNRLSHLTLASNNIKQIDLNQFPMSLTLLRLDLNSISEFPTTSTETLARLPLLEDLNLEHNEVKELNITTLLNVAPKLRLFSIGRNPIKKPVLDTILNELDERNIAYYNMERRQDSKCAEDEVRYRGACMPRDFFEMKWTDWLEMVILYAGIVLLLGGIAVGGTILWKRYRSRFMPDTRST